MINVGQKVRWCKMTDNYYEPLPIPAFPSDQPKDSQDVLTTLPLDGYSFDRACYDLASQFKQEDFPSVKWWVPSLPDDYYGLYGYDIYYMQNRLYETFSTRLVTIFIELLIEEISENLKGFSIPKKISIIKIEPRSTFYYGYNRLTFKVLVTVQHPFLTMLLEIFQRDASILTHRIRTIVTYIYRYSNINFTDANKFDLKRIDDVKYYKDWLNDTYNVLLQNQKMSLVSAMGYPGIPTKELKPDDLKNVCAHMFIDYFKQAALEGTLSSATGVLFGSVVGQLGINPNKLIAKATGIYREELLKEQEAR